MCVMQLKTFMIRHCRESTFVKRKKALVVNDDGTFFIFKAYSRKLVFNF